MVAHQLQKCICALSLLLLQLQQNVYYVVVVTKWYKLIPERDLILNKY